MTQIESKLESELFAQKQAQEQKLNEFNRNIKEHEGVEKRLRN